MGVVSTGSAPLDSLLSGGFERGVLTVIYGPAGSGKTTAVLMGALQVARQKKVLFLDTEGGFSLERLQQLSGKHTALTKNILVWRIHTFEEQQKAIAQLSSIASEHIGLIVCDTITALYRQQRSEQNNELNRVLSKQIGSLLELARLHDIPILLTNQVYADFNKKHNVHMVGGDMLTYNCKCIMEFQIVHTNVRKALLKKHRSQGECSIMFAIENEGFKALQ